jgi:hypothetical protein
MIDGAFGSSARSRPIFVVGLPRSGTTLLAAMLGAHPHIDCGPETRFFSWLERANTKALLDAASWPDRATEFVCGLRLQEKPVHGLFGISRDEVRAYLATRRPSIAAMLESLTAQRADRDGKPRWAEKTPRHLESLDRIRASWPEALVVRVVRDPRDVAVSMTRVPFGADSTVVNLCNGLAQDRASRAFFEGDRDCITVRYEDLIADAEGMLRRLCRFLDEDFDSRMLDRRDGADSIAADHEWWKRKAAEPLDSSRAGAWRTEMAPDVARFAALHCRDQLAAYGYEGAREPRRSVAVVPLGDRIAIKHDALLLALAAVDTVVAEPVPLGVGELGEHDEIVFWGTPGQIGLSLGKGALARTASIGRLSALLSARRARGRPAIWVRRHTNQPEHPDDPAEKAVANLLRVAARPATAEELRDLLVTEDDRAAVGP